MQDNREPRRIEGRHISMKHFLRILFVNRMAGMIRGGGETFDLEISAQLARMGCKVTFLTGKPLFGDRKTKGRQSEIDFNFIHSPYLPWFPWDKVKGGWRIRVWEFQQFEKKAARWIEAHADEFDIIQICELPYLVNLLKGKSTLIQSKIVIRLTAPNAHDPWGGIQLADAVIASGTSIEKVRRGLRPDVEDVPNGVDLEKFEVKSADVSSNPQISNLRHPASDFRARHNLPPQAPVLLYVARFQAFKNHKLLVDALARVTQSCPDVRLVLAGSGPLRQETETRCRQLGVHEKVTFLGEVSFEELPVVYAAADLMVISSEYESFCFAAIEAMASGLPVVTTDCGWVSKLIGDSQPPIEKQWVHGGDTPGRFETEQDGQRIRRVPGGLVVSRTEKESLANAIRMMIGDSAMRDVCGRWNRDKAVRDHGWANSAKKLLSVYQHLLS